MSKFKCGFIFIRMYWKDCCRGVAQLHAFNIIHMDVKLNNFVLLNQTIKVS